MKPATGSARLLIALIAFAWVGLAASLYYAGHKPFTPALALSVAVSVWRLAIAFWIVSLAGGLGQRILPAFSPGDSGAAAALRVAVHAALGLGLLALVILALGVLSSLRAWMLFLFSLLVELVLWRSVLG